MSGGVRHPTAAAIACPFCGGALVLLVDLVEDPDVVMRLADPRVVLDYHEIAAPDCELVQRAAALADRCAPATDGDER